MGCFEEVLGSEEKAGACGAALAERGGVAELRARCAHVSTQNLMSGAAAYQRCLVLHSCWRCEQQLSGLLSSSPGDPLGRSCRTVRMLLSVLHGIHRELAPTERALWEIFGRQDAALRGVLSRSQAGAAVREMLDAAQRRESVRQGHSRPVEPTQELRQLREECCARFVEDLFGNRRSATLADVLRVWWDTDE